MTYTVYSLTRAAGVTPYSVGVSEPGGRIAIGHWTRGDYLTPLHSFASHADAVAYQAQCIAHWSVSPAMLAPERYSRRAIECVTTGATYATASAASAATGVSASALSLHLNNPAQYPTAKGFIFRRVAT